jgi:membrane protease YdiL (CAAX protease family)
MSSQPEYLTPGPEHGGVSPDVVEIVPPRPLTAQSAEENWQADSSELDDSGVEPPTTPPSSEPVSDPHTDPLFAWYNQPPVLPPPRIPNLGDLGIVTLMLGGGWIGSGALLAIALHFHLWGITTIKEALSDIRYTLGSQAVWYLFAFGGCALLFPALWQKSFWAGLQWNGTRALLLRWRLISAAMACFLLAIVDGVLMPGPNNTPIDQIFRMPGAAWMLFGFGITLAPLFEEIAFRGFLLPALCTAYDWTTERFTGTLPRWPDENGHPRWSLSAMAMGSLVTSLPFALMHAEQTSYSLGPFLLLVCVSLVLCWVRLSTRSLAASVLVHSSYNFLLFSLMLAGTGGFKHLDKM